MDIIIFNIFKISALVMFGLSIISIFISYYTLVKIGNEDVKVNNTVRFYGIIIPSFAALVSLLILTPIILIELSTKL